MTSPRRHWRAPHFDRTNHEPVSWVYRTIAHLARNIVPLLGRTHWSGGEHIPKTGPVIVVANHIGNFDPIILGQYLIWQGRWPRFLGKADIWKVPGLGWVARQCGQIPVYRNTDRASESLIHAEEALAEGKMVAIYPEGTITADPDGWPMTGRRGAARLALTTGAPVVPVAQAGAELVLGGKHVDLRYLLRRRRDFHVVAGPPIDLSDYADREVTGALLDEVASHMIDVLTTMRAELTGLTPPAGRYDMRQGRRVEIEAGPAE